MIWHASKRVTNGHTDEQPETNMPHQLLLRWKHKYAASNYFLHFPVFHGPQGRSDLHNVKCNIYQPLVVDNSHTVQKPIYNMCYHLGTLMYHQDRLHCSLVLLESSQTILSVDHLCYICPDPHHMYIHLDNSVHGHCSIQPKIFNQIVHRYITSIWP